MSEVYGQGPVPPGAFVPKAGRPPLPTRDELAEVWRRALALVIDAAIVVALTLALVGLAGYDVTSEEGDRSGEVLETLWATLVALMVGAGIALVLPAVTMGFSNGRTIGKLLTGCRVVRADGKTVGFLWAFWRESVVKILLFGLVGSFLTGGIAYLIDVLWALWDKQRRALHDFVADSRVVKT